MHAYAELAATPVAEQLAAIEAAGFVRVDDPAISGDLFQHPDRADDFGGPMLHTAFGAYRSLFPEAG